MSDLAEKILLGVLGSGNLILFAKFLIERYDRKTEREEDNVLNGIKERFTKLEKDGLRTQMLLMILMRPEEKKEILTLAQHYFVDLKGNWYMTDMFNKWLEDEGHSKPEWFAEK